MPLKLCANLSFMFQQEPLLLERYALAARAGFRAVECAFPYEQPAEQVAAARGELRQVLINIHVGDASKGDLGTAALPGREEDFKKSLQMAIEYAKALDCERVHIMSGRVEQPTPEHQRTYEANIKMATSLLAQHNLIGLIEPINNLTVPHYFMNSYEKALALIESVNSPHLRLMMDIFHLQHLEGNLTHNIKKLLPYVGHIQVAQVPDRHEPDSPGEIDYGYVFSLLEQLGYPHWIGLEYRPRADTAHGLGWINKFGLKL